MIAILYLYYKVVSTYYRKISIIGKFMVSDK